MSNHWIVPGHMQRLWFIHAIANEPSSLHIGIELEICGRHDSDEVHAAVELAIRRHESFALRFTIGSMGTMCFLRDAPVAHWDVHDGYGNENIFDADQLARMAAKLHRGTIDIENGPSICATLSRLDMAISVLSITAHQLVADARTLRIVIEDILEEWRRIRGDAVRRRRSSPGFTQVLRSFGGAEAADTRMSRPRKEPVLARPDSMRVPPTNRGGRGDEYAFRLDENRVRDLRQVCGQSGVTLFSGLLTGFGMMASEQGIADWSDIGIVVSHRDLRTYGRTAGC